MKIHLSPPYYNFDTSFLSPWQLQVTLLLSFLIGITFVSSAQTKEWDASFGGYVTSVEDESISDYVPAENDWEAEEWYIGSSYIQDMVASPDGGYLLGGYSNSEKGKDKSEGRLSKYRNLDYWLVKIDAQGKKVWDKTLSGSIKTVVAIPGGGYLLGGTLSANSGRGISYGYEVIKIDNNGNRLWSKSFGSNSFSATNYPGLQALIATPEGGYLLSGLIYENKNGGLYEQGSWLVKIDESGTKLWDKTLSQSFTFIAVTAGGNSLLANAAQLVNINRNGTQLWQKAILLDFELKELISTPDGGYLLGGLYNNPITERGYDYKLLKLDPTGTKVWENAYGGNGYEGISIPSSFPSIALLATPDGNYLLGGNSPSDISGDKTEASRNESWDFWVLKISGRGNVIWDKTFGGFADDAITDLLPTLDGGYLLGGYSGSSNTGDKSEIRKSIDDYWVVKMKDNDDNPSLTLAPIADAYVQDGSYANTNYGKAPALVVKSSARSGYSRSAYLKFSLGSVSSVSSAKLRIYGNNTENTASINTAVYGVSNDAWAEGSITWNNAPVSSSTILSSVGVNNQGQYYELDVTSYVQAQLAGDKTVSLVVKDPSNANRNLTFNSKEHAANPPQLVIETASLALTPLADAYVRNGNYAGTNYGTNPSLVVKGTTRSDYARITYLKFDLGSVSAVTSAKVRVYGSNAENTNTVSLSAYGVSNDDWTESGLTWNNAPGTATAALNSVSVNSQVQYYELDVTGFVQAQLAGDKTVSLLLKEPANQKSWLGFKSRENKLTPPQLILQTPAVSNTMALRAQEPVAERIALADKSSVAPNPVQRRFTLTLDPQHAAAVSLQLVDELGRSYHIRPAGLKAGIKTEVDLSHLALRAGVYWLKITSSSQTEGIRLIVE